MILDLAYHWFDLFEEHISYGDGSDDSSQVGEKSAGYGVTGITYAYASEVDCKDIKGGIGRSLEDTTQTTDE